MRTLVADNPALRNEGMMTHHENWYEVHVDRGGYGEDDWTWTVELKADLGDQLDDVESGYEEGA